MSSPVFKHKPRRKAKLEPITLADLESYHDPYTLIDVFPSRETSKTTVPAQDDTVANLGTVANLDTVANLNTVANISTVGKLDTVSELPLPPTIETVQQNTPRIVYRCPLAQDGHSGGEDRLYHALWNASRAREVSKDTKTITVGWDLMAAAARMSPGAAKRNCLSLISKLALEIDALHDSNTRTGTTYKVYSYAYILQRRKMMGLEWVIRLPGGKVEFVNKDGSALAFPHKIDTVSKLSTVLILDGDTVSKLDTVTVSNLDRETVSNLDTPYSQCFSQESPPTSSSVSIDADAVGSTVFRLLKKPDSWITGQILERAAGVGATTAETLAAMTTVDLRKATRPGAVLLQGVSGFLDGLELYRAAQGREGKSRQTKILERVKLLKAWIDDSATDAVDRTGYEQELEQLLLDLTQLDLKDTDNRSGA